jgi:hypothetical protein
LEKKKYSLADVPRDIDGKTFPTRNQAEGDVAAHISPYALLRSDGD